MDLSGNRNSTVDSQNLAYHLGWWITPYKILDFHINWCFAGCMVHRVNTSSYSYEGSTCIARAGQVYFLFNKSNLFATFGEEKFPNQCTTTTCWIVTDSDFPHGFFPNRTFKLHLKTLMISPTFNPRNTGLTLLPSATRVEGFFSDFLPWRNTAMRRPPRFGRNEQFGKAVIFQSSMSLSLNLSLRVYNVVEHTVR